MKTMAWTDERPAPTRFAPLLPDQLAGTRRVAATPLRHGGELCPQGARPRIAAGGVPGISELATAVRPLCTVSSLAAVRTAVFAPVPGPLPAGPPA